MSTSRSPVFTARTLTCKSGFVRRLEVCRENRIAVCLGGFWPERFGRERNRAVTHHRDLELSEGEPIEARHLGFRGRGPRFRTVSARYCSKTAQQRHLRRRQESYDDPASPSPPLNGVNRGTAEIAKDAGAVPQTQYGSTSTTVTLLTQRIS